jgi:D-3-phosphoglycerate dehydrogenase
MVDAFDALVLDLLEWVGASPRPNTEVMEAWRTSCPHLPVWEEANERGFVARHYEPGHGAMVVLTTSGLQYLRQHRFPAAQLK